MAPKQVDEDCLTLNVWRPADSDEEPRPVMVWIYGGAFVTGGGAIRDLRRRPSQRRAGRHRRDRQLPDRRPRLPRSATRCLAATPTDTNCGLRDQLLALEWVQRHIAQFGGDPARVTVFGESAGAGSIMHLLAAPGIESRTKRAIAQSPGIDFTQTAELSAVVAQAFAEQAGAKTVDDLRALPPARLVEAQEAVATELLFDVGTMVFHPVVDGDIVPATPSLAIAERARRTTSTCCWATPPTRCARSRIHGRTTSTKPT